MRFNVDVTLTGQTEPKSLLGSLTIQLDCSPRNGRIGATQRFVAIS